MKLKINTKIIGFIALFLCCIKLFYQTQNYIDVEFTDEGMYLRYGLDMFEKIRWYWAPTYNLWYKFLSVFTQNPIELYYLNFIILGSFIPILFYLFLIRIKVNRLLSFWLSFCFLISSQHVLTFAKVSHFAVFVFLIGLYISTFIQSNIRKIFVIFISVFIASFARPELFLTLILILFYTLFICIKNRKIISKIDLGFVLFMVLIVVLNMYFSKWNSFEFLGYKRAVFAFYDHYTLKLFANKTNIVDNWTYWEEVAKERFNSTNNMTDLFINYPKIMIKHIISNSILYVFFVVSWLTNILVPYSFTAIQSYVIYGFILLFVLFFIFVLIHKNIRNSIIENIKKYHFYTFILLSFSLPSVLACFLIFPRTHYIYQQIPFFIVFLSIIISAFLKNYLIIKHTIHLKKIAFVIFFISILITPRIYNYKQFFIFKTYNSTKKNTLCYKELIYFLNKYKPEQTHQVFTNIPMFHAMFNKNIYSYNTLMDKRMNTNFDSFRIEKNIDIIIYTKSLITDSHVNKDSSWLYFINNFEKYNFKKRKYCTSCDIELLVK